MENSKRNFVKIISEICEEEEIELSAFSSDWIFKLCKNNMYNYIFGYHFGLNSASVHSICCDKSAASEVMTSLGIPNIEHKFFMSPINQKYIGENGNWNTLIDYLKEHNKIVCKSNEGTGGNQVFLVSNQYELENAVHKIFRNSHAMAVSPYYNIENEYRAIVLDGEIMLIYSKERPFVMGDGIRSIKQLIADYMINNDFNLFDFESCKYNLSEISEENKRYELNWKHNLGQGSKATLVENCDVKKRINNIVQMVVEKMNIRFASVDIVEQNREYKVLEINSGVMMEHYSQQDDYSYTTAKEIYRSAILNMFKEGYYDKKTNNFSVDQGNM